MIESKLIQEGRAYAERANAKSLREAKIMKTISENKAMEVRDGELLLKSVNENSSAVQSIVEMFNKHFNDEVYRIIEMTKQKFNTNYNLLIESNSGENALGESVIFETSRPTHFQVVTNDLDCITTIVSEATSKRFMSLISVDRITEANEIGFDKNSSKTNEAMIFTFSL